MANRYPGTMGLMFWDGVFRGGTAVLLALLAWNFGQDWRRSQTARLGLLLTVSGLSIRYDRAIFWVQGRLARRRALARMMSFRMMAVMATLAGFPAATRA